MGNANSQMNFKLDHTFEEMKNVRATKDVSRDNSISTISQLNLVENEVTEHQVTLEKPSDRRTRFKSHWVIYATTLNVAIGFSIVLTGIYPYLKLLEDDPNVSKVKSAVVISCNPLGQLMASPIAGFVGNKLGGVRYVCYFTMTAFTLGSLLYGMLPACTDLWPDSAFHLMLLSRFIVGLSSSNVVLCRSYIAQATTITERTRAISKISAAQALGFIIGPALQVILSLAIEDDMTKYRSTGFVAAAMALGNMVLLTPCIFKEFDVAKREREGLEAKLGSITLPKVDYVAMAGILYGFFFLQFVSVLIESLLEPLFLDQYAWCDNLAVIVAGTCMMIGGILTIIMFLLAPKLSRRFGERTVLIFIGYVMVIVGLFLFIPWGPNTLKYCPEEPPEEIWSYSTANYYLNSPSIYSDDSMYSTTTLEPFIYDERYDIFNKLCANVTHCLGCPPQQDWCIDSKQLAIGQFLVAFVILISGFPFGVTMTNAIYSKLLGLKKQGMWMGMLTATGSLARISGPVFVSYVYANLGTTWAFGILVTGTFTAILELTILYKRLVPMKIPTELVSNKF